ncbi:unnamed protein product [Bemisia tabaci]|uniref:Uncharacterized protein n=1 Tax=Bemisia tabaci TaxID=7038 RepID=A0A9P0AQR8_BEMTA|nr:unnamed protein product [Bemisia tabaci]
MTGLGILNQANCCTQIKNSTILAYNTTRTALFQNGQLIIPLSIDLVQSYTICNRTYPNTALAWMFKISKGSPPYQPQDRPRSRQKRAAPGIPLAMAGAFAAATAVWEGYSYGKTNGRIEELRTEIRSQDSYFRKVITKNKQSNLKHFYAMRRELQDFSLRTRENICEVGNYTRVLIMENYMVQQFNDLLWAIQNRRISPSIIPPNQLKELIKQTGSLQNSLYATSPYLFYLTARILINMQELPEDGTILRATVVIPLLKRQERVIMTTASKWQNNKLSVFEPSYVAADSGLSVENCEREAEHYFCTDAHLKKIEATEISTPVWYEDGVAIIGEGELAIKQEKEDGPKVRITGPAVCTQGDTYSVTHGNNMIFTHSIAFHVRAANYSWDIAPYDIKLNLADNKVQDLEDSLNLIHDETSTRHALQLALTIFFTALTVAVLIHLHRRQAKHARFVKNFDEAGIPLQEVLVVQETLDGRGTTRRITRD